MVKTIQNETMNYYHGVTKINVMSSKDQFNKWFRQQRRAGRIGVFTDNVLAQSAADKRGYSIVLGDHNEYWIVSTHIADRLEEMGYEVIE